jgi:alkylation response protein AidB-like acyl-CoA dehydrogenase
MDFEPSDDQRLLVESVTRMLGDTYGFAQRKSYMALPEGYSPAIWSQFAELGLLGLPFAEEYGGFGGGAQEVMLVMQAFGRVLVLEPYFPTVVLAGTAVNRAGSVAQKQAILPAIAEGRLKMAFAHGERQARYDLTDVVTTAKRNGSGWVLDGSKTVVSHGEAADRIIVSARTSADRHDEDGCSWSMRMRRAWQGAGISAATIRGRRTFPCRMFRCRMPMCWARLGAVCQSFSALWRRGSRRRRGRPSGRWKR